MMMESLLHFTVVCFSPYREIFIYAKCFIWTVDSFCQWTVQEGVLGLHEWYGQYSEYRVYYFPEIYRGTSLCHQKTSLLQIKVNRAVISVQNENGIKRYNWFLCLFYFSVFWLLSYLHCNQAGFLFKQRSRLQSDTFNVILLCFCLIVNVVKVPSASCQTMSMYDMYRINWHHHTE